MRFESFGMTDDPDLTTVTSVLDYVFRRLALDFLDADVRSKLGIYSLDDEARQLTTDSSLREASAVAVKSNETVDLTGLARAGWVG
jgi:ribonucleoside-diphosphate reductase alpha chain